MADGAECARKIDRQRGHLLQLGNPVPAIDQVEGGALLAQISPATWWHIHLSGHVQWH